MTCFSLQNKQEKHTIILKTCINTICVDFFLLNSESLFLETLLNIDFHLFQACSCFWRIIGFVFSLHTFLRCIFTYCLRMLAFAASQSVFKELILVWSPLIYTCLFLIAVLQRVSPIWTS